MRKVLITGGAIALTIALSPLIAAFEAHVVNVTAQIENGLSVPIEEIKFGIVFPQERLDKTFDVSLSESYLAECSEEPGEQYASSVVSTSQGVRKNGTAVLPDRSDPTKSLGAPQSSGAPSDSPVVAGSFYSLGFSANQNSPGGSLELGFTNYIVDIPGTDITVFEITGGVYPDERISLEVSQDGSLWHPTTPAIGARDASFDMAPLPWARYVRITDQSDKTLFEQTADAYDLDAVRATSREVLCGDISYVIRQKPKCVDAQNPSFHPQVGEDGEGNFVCQQGSTMMPILCPYLSKHEITNDPDETLENDSPGITAFHGLPGEWILATTIATQVEGALSVFTEDTLDTWNIDLKVPCFRGQCAQDWPNFVREESGNPGIDVEAYKADPALEHVIFGCDLWVEVTLLN